MKYLYITLSVFLLLFSGCGTKRQYFEPKDVSGSVSYDGSLPSDISNVGRYGATLQNGQIITKDGLSSVKMEEGFDFFGKFDDKIISVNDSGKLKILDLNGNMLYEREFPQAVTSASVSSNVLAVVDSNNILYLVNIQKNEVYFTSKQDSAYALDSKIAAPLFVNSLVIFPTLDGKLVIVDWKRGTKIRDVAISSENFFNNVIYLQVVNGKLLAATQTRVLSISPRQSAYFDENIKDVITSDNNIYVLSNDGRVILLNEKLKEQKQKKFLFAVFLGVVNNDKLLIVEKNGHLISVGLNLENSKVYKLPDEIDDLTFISKDTLFYKDRFIKLYE